MAKHKDIDFRVFARGAGKVMTYHPDEVIFSEGDDSHSMFIVLSGSVDIASHGKAIETIGEGRALGFASVLDNRPRATTARAHGECELAVMDRRKFRYMVDEVPNFAWYVMLELTQRLRMLNEAINSSGPANGAGTTSLPG